MRLGFFYAHAPFSCNTNFLKLYLVMYNHMNLLPINVYYVAICVEKSFSIMLHFIEHITCQNDGKSPFYNLIHSSVGIHLECSRRDINARHM